MLDVILGEDIYNVAVVVTRYFGGVLLGTGGLVRAYSGAVQAGLGASKVIEELNIRMRKSMRRCPFLYKRGGALFRLKMEAVMEQLCLE